jgi:hypothetical protein
VFSEETFPYVIAALFGVNTSVPIELLEDFITQPIDPALNKYKQGSAVKQNAINQTFGYGVDEIFLNKVLLPHFIASNKTINVIRIHAISMLLRIDERLILGLPKSLHDWLCDYYDFCSLYIIKGKASKPGERQLANAFRAACRGAYLFKSNDLASDTCLHFIFAAYHAMYTARDHIKTDTPPMWTNADVINMLE